MFNYQNFFNNSFMGYYINDYSEALNYACPSDGSAILLVNLDQNLMYSKKMINGQSFIQGYRIMPINNETKPPEVIPKTTTDDKLDKLLELLLRREYESTNDVKYASEPGKNE